MHIPLSELLVLAGGGGNHAPPFSCALRAGASANYILIIDERRPSGRELLRLQGFPDEYKMVVNYTQIRLKLRIKKPPTVDHDEFLKAIRFDPSWIEIVR